jgi:hypothetical protein
LGLRRAGHRTLKEAEALVTADATLVQAHLFEMAIECDRLAKSIEEDVDRLRDELYEYSRRLAARGALEWATRCPTTTRIEEKRTELHTLAQQVERLFPAAFDNRTTLGACLAALGRIS